MPRPKKQTVAPGESVAPRQGLLELPLDCLQVSFTFLSVAGVGRSAAVCGALFGVLTDTSLWAAEEEEEFNSGNSGNSGKTGVFELSAFRVPEDFGTLEEAVEAARMLSVAEKRRRLCLPPVIRLGEGEYPFDAMRGGCILPAGLTIRGTKQAIQANPGAPWEACVTSITEGQITIGTSDTDPDAYGRITLRDLHVRGFGMRIENASDVAIQSCRFQCDIGWPGLVVKNATAKVTDCCFEDYEDMEMGEGIGVHVIRCSCHGDQNTLLELHGCCNFGGNDVDLLASTCIDRDVVEGESGQNTLIILKSRNITHTRYDTATSLTTHDEFGRYVCSRGYAEIASHYEEEEMQHIETNEPFLEDY
jgi:hypothetical protein